MIAWNRVQVAGDVQARNAGLMLQSGVATLKDRNGVTLAEREGAEITAQTRRGVTLTFPDGSTWEVKRSGGCGCR